MQVTVERYGLGGQVALPYAEAVENPAVDPIAKQVRERLERLLASNGT